MNANEAIVEVINAELAVKGVSVYRLAKDTDISQPTLARALAGKIDITFDRVAVICKALDLPLSSVARAVERLLDGDHKKPAKKAAASTKKTAPAKKVAGKNAADERYIALATHIIKGANKAAPAKKTPMAAIKKRSTDAYLEGIRNRNR